MNEKVRECGECNACCKTHAVVELNKPDGKWCTHAAPGKGCAIYGSHPKSCKEFSCAWLMGLGDESERPDKTKFVIDPVNYPGCPPGGVVQLWEVTEGALTKGNAMDVTFSLHSAGQTVLHIPLRGKKRMYISNQLDDNERKKITSAAIRDGIEIS